MPVTLLGALLAAPAAWADSGGTTTIRDNWYVGTLGATGNTNVIVDTVPPHTPPYEHAAGGYAKWGDATKNTLTIERAGVVEQARGGWAYNDGSATGNNLTIWGTVNDNAMGGESSYKHATGNTVLLDGNVARSVWGGYGYLSGTGNTVFLAGGTVGRSVFGGYCAPDGCNEVTDNSLIVQAEVSVGNGVGNFDTLKFDLPSSIKAGDVVLDVGGAADFSTVPAANFSFTLADGALLNPGDTITLIKAGTLTITPPTTPITTGGYEFEVSQVGNNLIACVERAIA